MKYLWAAYRKGALNDLHPVFLDDLSKEDFEEAVALLLSAQNFAAWTMIAETKGGIMPVAFMVGWVNERVVSFAKMIPFPWSSSRNILESMANAFDTVRKQVHDESLEIDDPYRYFTALAFTEFRDKKFYEKIQDMGILRKVGHVLDMQPSGTSILFQTKSPVRGR